MYVKFVVVYMIVRPIFRTLTKDCVYKYRIPTWHGSKSTDLSQDLRNNNSETPALNTSIAARQEKKSYVINSEVAVQSAQAHKRWKRSHPSGCAFPPWIIKATRKSKHSSWFKCQIPSSNPPTNLLCFISISTQCFFVFFWCHSFSAFTQISL